MLSRIGVVSYQMRSAKEYVLGTQDDEIERLGLQHRAWAPRVLAAWKSAGIRTGQTVIDVGCGPGYASLDLAQLVGPEGHVIAIDQSESFLNALASAGRVNISVRQADLETGEFPRVRAHAAWCRWVLCFVRNPKDVLANIAAVLEPGGVIVIHEYFDYAAWRAAPPCDELIEFVASVMASWRHNGGEPDIGLQLPYWLEELGFDLDPARPIIELIDIDHSLWAWLRAFVRLGRHRLVDLGYLTPGQSERIWETFARFEATPGARMFTPALLEIVARR